MTESQVALFALLELPDPPCLKRPRYVCYTQMGDPDRLETILPQLVMAYGVWRIEAFRQEAA